MKNSFDKAMESLIDQEDKKLFDQFISNYSSREERHYCAYLFSWLINDPGAIELFFKNHSPAIPNLSNTDFNNAKIYYEYTAIRELLDLIGRKVKHTTISNHKRLLKKKIEGEIFFDIDNGDIEVKKGDIQKKKPDLVFYFPDSKNLVLVEAKFEMGFQEAQIKESKKYGHVLKTLFPDAIKNVYVTALGLDYYLQNIKEPCLTISWKKIYEILPKGNVKNEIECGLNYQKKIHPNAMLNWEYKHKII